MKKKKFFRPAVIATTVQSALTRDLDQFLHVYKGQLDPTRKIAVERLRDEFLKKFSEPSRVETLERKTYKKFLKVNAHMRKYNAHLGLPYAERVALKHVTFRDQVLLRARSLMRSVLSDYTWEEFFRACKHGPGTTIGVPFEDTSMERKFQFPISATLAGKHLFDQYLHFDQAVKVAIDEINSDVICHRYEIVEGSRATTVPKTDDIRRMIAVEPTANMFLQQGAMALMYQRMASVGLDVEVLPSRHKRLAWESSITRKYATIDFSSASDCVSTELLRWLLPKKWFSLMESIRSPFMTIKGKKVDLNMFSTMGNAGTFPLETLVFWTIAHAVDLTLNAKNASILADISQLDKRISVFGDDCIVPSHQAHLFISVCESVGFIVNKEKSHVGADAFRESCGGDYHTGYAVRPFHLKWPPRDSASSLEAWLYTIWNSLLKKYKLYFGERNYIYYSNLFTTMQSLFKEHGFRLKIVPPDYPEDSGLQLSEINRFLACYEFELSPIHRSHHGTYRFQFLRFRYRNQRAQNDTLRYADWLRKPVSLSQADVPHKWNNIRRIGGYSVAKGISSQWDVSVDNS